MQSMSYLGIILLVLISPIPSEVVMPLAGFMAAQGKLNLFYAVLAATLGSLIGALPWYLAGKYLGEPGLQRLARRSGGWLKISADDINQSRAWFNQHGGKAVMLCRAVPGVRTFISIPAGISGMPMLVFVFYTTLGAFIWEGILGGSGYVLGNRYYLVKQYLGPASNVVLAVLLVTVVTLLLRRKMRRAKTKPSSSVKKTASKL